MVRCELVNSTSTSKDMIICLNSNPPLGKILYRKQLQITHGVQQQELDTASVNKLIIIGKSSCLHSLTITKV